MSRIDAAPPAAVAISDANRLRDLAEIARYADGRHCTTAPSTQTVRRWGLRGFKIELNGIRYSARLKLYRTGQKLATTFADVDAFFKRLNALQNGEAPIDQSAEQADTACAEAAGKELEVAGF